MSIQPRSTSTASGGGTQSGRRAERSVTSAASHRLASLFALKYTSPLEVGTRMTVDHG
jgi:hypothetical protein